MIKDDLDDRYVLMIWDMNKLSEDARQRYEQLSQKAIINLRRIEDYHGTLQCYDVEIQKFSTRCTSDSLWKVNDSLYDMYFGTGQSIEEAFDNAYFEMSIRELEALQLNGSID